MIDFVCFNCSVKCFVESLLLVPFDHGEVIGKLRATGLCD
jgi:hypothetical protein